MLAELLVTSARADSPAGVVQVVPQALQVQAEQAVLRMLAAPLEHQGLVETEPTAEFSAHPVILERMEMSERTALLDFLEPPVPMASLEPMRPLEIWVPPVLRDPMDPTA